MVEIKSTEVDAEIPAPEINQDKVCFIIAKARELEAEDEGLEADDSNPTDDESRSILTDEAYDTIRKEAAEFIDALDDDEKAELVALVWTGRGDYSAREWRVAVADARSRQELETSVYLLGIPLLSDYLEAGLAQFDMSCQDFDASNYG
ncbi:MAG: DUF3775 domain-containing protein [Methylovirgula sp.]